MKRSLMALCLAASSLLAVPDTSDAGLIPWMYDSVFGYGPRYSARRAYRLSQWYGPYSTYYGYSPYSYSAPYYVGYSGYSPGCCGVVSNYAPAYSYYGGWDSGCCSPCGGCSSCGTSPCGISCGGGCSNCSVGVAGAASTSTTSGRNEPEPTYAPGTNAPGARKQPATDDFTKPERRGSGSPSGGTGGRVTPDDGGNAQPFDPINNASPAPGEPQGNDPDAHVSPPANPLDLNEKVAFTARASFTRMHAEPRFRIPTIVRSTPRVPLDAPVAPTAVAAR